jgi:hypothetical protein
MFRQWWKRLALLLERQLLPASFALTVGGILLGCLEVTAFNISSGIPGGIFALIGLVGMIVSIPFHREPEPFQ